MHGASMKYDGLRVDELSLGSELHRGSLGRLSAASLDEQAVLRLLGTTLGTSERARRCAVRTLGTEASVGADHVSMVRRESDIGARALSPHVVRHFAVQGGPVVFSAMELVDGLSLAAIAERAPSRAQLIRCVPRIGVDVLTGLSALHDLTDDAGRPAGVVHQAPVARHILVGVDGVARLVDLSLAVGLGHRSLPGISARLRPHEMAPEQAFAPEHVDARCDVFIAAGAIWQGLSGHPLFAHAAPEAALQRMLRMAIPSFAELGLPAAASVERVLLRGLERSRRARAASARELAAELEIVARAAGQYAEREEVAELVASLQQARALPATFHPQPAAEPTSEPVAPAPTGPAPTQPAGTILGYASLPPEAQAVLRSAGLRLPGDSAPVVVERSVVIADEPVVELPAQRMRSAGAASSPYEAASSPDEDSRFWTLPEAPPMERAAREVPAARAERDPWRDLPEEPRPGRLGLWRGLAITGVAAALLAVALWAELTGRGDERARALPLPGAVSPALEQGPVAPPDPSATARLPGHAGAAAPEPDPLAALLAELPAAEPRSAGPAGAADAPAPRPEGAALPERPARPDANAGAPARRRRPRAAEPPVPAAPVPGEHSKAAPAPSPGAEPGPSPAGHGRPPAAPPDEPLGTNPYD
jgi:hypothetical protein